MTTSTPFATVRDLDNPDGWYLYRFHTRLRCARHGHGCRRTHRGYIGISNQPWRREKEHQADKWWHRYTCGWEVDERVFATEADAREAERQAIVAELPLFNDVHNRGNPCRLTAESMGVLPAHRPVRMPPRFRPEVRRPDAVVRRVRRRAWTRRERNAATAAVLWAVLLLPAWWWLGRHGVHGWLALRSAAVPVSTAMGWGWSRTLPRRSLLRRAVGVAAFVGLVASAWLLWPAGWPLVQAHWPAVRHLLGGR